jgi:hypothetical protein
VQGTAGRRTVSIVDAQVQRQRGQEFFHRDAELAEDVERKGELVGGWVGY